MTRPSAWRVRARARAALALGSALACAVVTSALLLSGSVRALRGALTPSVDGTDHSVVASESPQKSSAAQREIASDARRHAKAGSTGAALASREGRAFSVASSRAMAARSIASRSLGTEVARGYDATAPPVERG